MDNFQNSKIICSETPLIASSELKKQLLADGYVVLEDELPTSIIGKKESAYAAYYYCNLGNLCFVVGIHDYTSVDESTQEIEFCGYSWCVVNKISNISTTESYINDWHHSFGKGAARLSLKNSIVKYGMADFDGFWASFGRSWEAFDIASKQGQQPNEKQDSAMRSPAIL